MKRHELVKQKFDISGNIYLSTLIAFSLWLIFQVLWGSKIDVGSGVTVARVLFSVIAVFSGAVLVRKGVMSHNNALGIILYAAVVILQANLAVASSLPVEQFVQQFYATALISITLIGISGYLVVKSLAVVASIAIAAELAFFAFTFGDAYLRIRIVYMLAAIGGINFVIVAYRLQLEKLVIDLTDTQERLAAERDLLRAKKLELLRKRRETSDQSEVKETAHAGN
jgi:hypothetical protein